MDCVLHQNHPKPPALYCVHEVNVIAQIQKQLIWSCSILLVNMADKKLFFGLLLSLICGTMWTPIGDQKIGGERVRFAQLSSMKKWIQDDKRNQYENKNVQSTWNEQCYNRKSIRSHRIIDLPPHETLNDIITSWPRKYLLRNLSNHHLSSD